MIDNQDQNQDNTVSHDYSSDNSSGDDSHDNKEHQPIQAESSPISVQREDDSPTQENNLQNIQNDVVAVQPSGDDSGGGDDSDNRNQPVNPPSELAPPPPDIKRHRRSKDDYTVNLGERNQNDVDNFKEGERLRQKTATGYHDSYDYIPPPSSVPLPPLRGTLKPRDKEGGRAKGPVLRYLQGAWLADNVARFTVYDLCLKARALLKKQRMILLQGGDDTLAYQMALWLLHDNLSGFTDSEEFPAYNTTIPRGLTDFLDDFPHEEDGVYYLVTNITDLAFANISSSHIEQIQHHLEKSNSYLVITASADKKLPLTSLRSVYFLVDKLPATKEVVATVIHAEPFAESDRQYLLKEIANDNSEGWKRVLAQPTTLQEMYALADRICALWRKEGLAGIQTLFVELESRQVRDWFNRHPEWEHRAYMITLAVLDGAQPNEITSAYHQLIEKLGLDANKKRLPLEEMLAGTRTTYEYATRVRRTRVNGFAIKGLFALVLYHVFDELYREDDPTLHKICEWLLDLATSTNNRVQNLTARAIGTLSVEYFKYIEETIIDQLILKGAIFFATANLSKLLQSHAQTFATKSLVGELIKVMKDLSVDQDTLIEAFGEIDDATLSENNRQNMELAQVFEAIRKLIDEPVKQSLAEADRYFTVLGNIFAYGIESDNDEYRVEVLDLVSELTNPAYKATIIKKHVDPKEIRRELLNTLGKLDENLKDFVISITNEEAFDKAIENSLIVYQQIVGLAVHFYSGGHVVERACQDLTRVTNHKNTPHLADLMSVLRSTIRGMIIKRLNLPGDPRKDIERLLRTVKKWIDDGEKLNHEEIHKDETNNNDDKRKSLLYFLGLDIFCDLAFRVTEILTQDEENEIPTDADRQANPLLNLDFTDWPLLLFLSLYSDPIQDITTALLRHLIGRTRKWPHDGTVEYWQGVTEYFLDKPKQLGSLEALKQMGDDQYNEFIPEDSWTMREQGFGIIEHWMLFAQGRRKIDKPYIKQVKDVGQYQTHLKRIVAETLAWYPGEKTRNQLIKFLRKRAKANQTVAPIAKELMDFIENYTNPDGSPN